MASAQQKAVWSPAAALPPRPAGLHASARPFTAAQSRRRRPHIVHRTVLQACQEPPVAAPRAASAPAFDVDSQSAAAAQPQSLELQPLSQANVTAEQPVSKFSVKRQQRKEARQRWADDPPPGDDGCMIHHASAYRGAASIRDTSY
jgi:hypothetical protein